MDQQQNPIHDTEQQLQAFGRLHKRPGLCPTCSHTGIIDLELTSVPLPWGDPPDDHLIWFNPIRDRWECHKCWHSQS